MNINENLQNPLDLKLINCEFYFNKSPKCGAALNYGTYNYLSKTRLLFNNCNIYDNEAENGEGALFIQTVQGVELEECHFKKNKSTNDKATIYIQTHFQVHVSENEQISSPIDENSKIVFNKCTFENEDNSKCEICIDDCTKTQIEIIECYFTDCISNGQIVSFQKNAESILIKNCTFLYTIDTSLAAAVFLAIDNITIIGSTFQNCDKNTILIGSQTDGSHQIEIIENEFLQFKNARYSKWIFTP